jgi:hypothetical protein
VYDNFSYTPTTLGVREIMSGVREQKRLNTTDVDSGKENTKENTKV